MRDLKRLNEGGRALVRGEALLADGQGPDFREEHFEDAGVQYDHDRIEELLGAAVAEYEPGRTGSAMDRDLAPSLHRALPLSRRIAADTAVWHYLTAAVFPWFVRHRWRRSRGDVTKERMLGSTKRNALARLWWGAELTAQDGDNYDLTRILLAPGGGQDLFEQLLGHRFSHYPAASRSFVEKARDLSRGAIRQTAEGLSQMATTLVLESMDPGEVNELVERLVESATEE